MRVVKCIALLAGLFVWISAAAVTAQSPLNPTVAMSVTLPDGKTQELSAPEGGLATVKVGDREYGFRPTMFDDQGARMAVTIFDMGSRTEAIKEIGTVDLKGNTAPVASKTSPPFKVAAHKSGDWKKTPFTSTRLSPSRAPGAPTQTPDRATALQ
jgi:hypothetical protein